MRFLQPTPDNGACCEACAESVRLERPAREERIRLERPAREKANPRRLSASRERRITLLAIAIAAGFVALALLSLLAPANLRQSSWLPLHLLLAGAAPTAIAGVMPFFSSALSGAPSARVGIRLAGVLGIAIGAVVVIAGRAIWPAEGGSLLSGLGGLLYLGGLVVVGTATLLPLRVALGARRLFVGATYGMAMLNVLLGTSLATLFLLGSGPVVAAWGALKPAHAWLNLFGFLSLVIAGSLLHLLPTVVGARISRTRASLVCFAALGAGPLLVAAGFVQASDVLAVAGGLVVVAGAAALALHSGLVLRALSMDHRSPLAHLHQLVVGGRRSLVPAGYPAGRAAAASPGCLAGWLEPCAAAVAAGRRLGRTGAGRLLVSPRPRGWTRYTPTTRPAAADPGQAGRAQAAVAQRWRAGTRPWRSARAGRSRGRRSGGGQCCRIGGAAARGRRTAGSGAPPWLGSPRSLN